MIAEEFFVNCYNFNPITRYLIKKCTVIFNLTRLWTQGWSRIPKSGFAAPPWSWSRKNYIRLRNTDLRIERILDKTCLSPLCVRAEHSRYLTALILLASFCPCSRLRGACPFSESACSASLSSRRSIFVPGIIKNICCTFFFVFFFGGPQLCLCRPFCIFERCLDSSPELPYKDEPEFWNVYGAEESISRNQFRQSTVCSPEGRYDNPIPTWFLTPLECLKISAQARYRSPSNLTTHLPQLSHPSPYLATHLPN